MHSGDTRGCPLHPFNANWDLAENVVANHPSTTDRNMVITSVLLAHNANADDNDDDDGTIPVASVLESHNGDDDESFRVDDNVEVLGKSANSDNEYKDNDGNDEENEDDDGVDDDSDDDVESEESVEVVGKSSNEDEDEYNAQNQEKQTTAGGKSSDNFMSDFNNFLADDSNFDAFHDPAEAEDDYNNLVSGRLIGGGPTKPDTTGMTESRAAAVLRQYRGERKTYTDKLRSDQLRKAATAFDAAIVYIVMKLSMSTNINVFRNTPLHSH
jgi:hypothetical protein